MASLSGGWKTSDTVEALLETILCDKNTEDDSMVGTHAACHLFELLCTSLCEV